MAIGKDAILKHLLAGDKLFGKKFIGYHIITEKGHNTIKCNNRSIEALIQDDKLIVSGENNEQLILNQTK